MLEKDIAAELFKCYVLMLYAPQTKLNYMAQDATEKMIFSQIRQIVVNWPFLQIIKNNILETVCLEVVVIITMQLTFLCTIPLDNDSFYWD